MDFQKYDDIFNITNYPSIIEQQGDYVADPECQCICLSGKKYKDCCKHEIDQVQKYENTEKDIVELKELYFVKESKLLSYKITDKAINKKNISYCAAEKIFGNCDMCNKRKSHTMSKGNVLSNLAGKNCKIIKGFNDHIMQEPEFIKQDISCFFKDFYLDEASLTVSFCKKHDVELFVDIETDGNMEYIKSDIQNLEYALKAVSFEIYYKLENIKYLASLIQRTKKVLCSYKGEKSSFMINYKMMISELFNLYPIQEKILKEIKDLKDYGKKPTLKTICIDLPFSKVNMSCSEVLKENEYCFVNVINSPKPHMILSYYGVNNSIEKMKEMYDKDSNKKIFLYNFFVSNLLCNATNIYFNKDAFDKLKDEIKVYLYVIHREGNYNIPEECHKKYVKEMFAFLFNMELY